MSIRITPDPVPAEAVRTASGGHITCPSCHSQTTRDREDIGWVRCPILNRFVCLGCCLDIAVVCASRDFEGHSFIGDVERVARVAGLLVTDARLICLRHQLELLPQQERAGISYAEPFEQIEKHLRLCLREALDHSSQQGDGAIS